MSPVPSGRLVRSPRGRDLVITRTFRAPIEDVWASITEPERTARWFGPWEGEPGPGRRIRYWMLFEQNGAETPLEMTIDACEAPRHLALSAVDDWGSWYLELTLSHADGITELRFTQHLDETTEVGSVGPGWEYYLDNLVAARDGTPLPRFEDYYPSQQAYYQGQAAALPAAG